MNLISLLQKRALERFEETAYLFLADGEVEAARLTYGELDRQARGIGAALSALNAAGERVLLEGAQGASLVPLFAGEQKPLRDYLILGDDGARALRSLSWALLPPVREGEAARLYVKPDDQWEVNDVAKQHFAEAEELERTLRQEG